MIITISITSFIVGFVIGALVTRNNVDEVNKIVEDAQDLAEKAQAELAEYKAKQKKTTKSRAKKTVKKPIVD